MSKTPENITVVLPDNGVIDVAWAREQLERASLFSSFDLNANKGRIFFMLKTSLSEQGYEQSVKELEYTVETSELYIRFLSKLPVLEAIKDKYYVAISLSASELIPDSIEDAMALLDVTIARVGKPTADNLRKALEISGKAITKMSDAAISVEAMKKKALHEWLLSEYGLSDDDIMNAQRIDTSGKSEFLEKALQAFSLLEDWKVFYQIIATPVHESGDSKALRFLSDINDAAASIQEFLKLEAANHQLIQLKDKFNSEVFPEMSFKANTAQ